MITYHVHVYVYIYMSVLYTCKCAGYLLGDLLSDLP